MVIKYKSKRLTNNLIFGLVWLVLGVAWAFSRNFDSWIDYGYLVIATLYLGSYFYERKNQYLTVENGAIRENFPFGKKIELDEVNQFQRFAGDYILKTEHSKMTINTQIIEENSLKELNRELEKLNL